MTIVEFQQWVSRFYGRRGWTGYGPFIRTGFLMEEVGELVHAVRAAEIGRDRPDESPKTPEELREELVEELGDVLGNLVLLADQYGLSLEEIMESHRNKLLNRFDSRSDRVGS
ncbi:hypothetical protein O3V59_09370 [Brevibacillus thermoruber]|uniref:NTP pyrophosphohydrolase MazG-like domain-containing protein n=1 Tax=Brevibacillus thermoruber TaxID=33942 RepID=A0A9X3TQD8_9BACL|nr:MazG nucleotide pyrophosphohydrolase domain-containing protein [Brevibacillus thermoruber]MDA5108570.1 hypothetical protein [Brevibacillus thermoruber]